MGLRYEIPCRQLAARLDDGQPVAALGFPHHHGDPRHDARTSGRMGPSVTASRRRDAKAAPRLLPDASPTPRRPVRQGGSPAVGRSAAHSAHAPGTPTHSSVLRTYRLGLVQRDARCDAVSPTERGLLSLADEIDRRRVGIGVHLNWGRSAVENLARRLPSRAYSQEPGNAEVLDIVFSGAGPELPALLDRWARRPVDLPHGRRTDRTLRAGSVAGVPVPSVRRSAPQHSLTISTSRY